MPETPRRRALSDLVRGDARPLTLDPIAIDIDVRPLFIRALRVGTYPYHRGGVSTWCHALTSKLSDVEFTVLALAMHP